MKKPTISVILRGVQGGNVVDELQNMPLPHVGERLYHTLYKYESGRRTDALEQFCTVVTRITHVPHGDYPQVWIYVRRLNFIERLFN